VYLQQEAITAERNNNVGVLWRVVAFVKASVVANARERQEERCPKLRIIRTKDTTVHETNLRQQLGHGFHRKVRVSSHKCKFLRFECVALKNKNKIWVKRFNKHQPLEAHHP
jgi:hypothetical protein